MIASDHSIRSVFSARLHNAIARYMPSPVRTSVRRCPSVTWVDQAKMVEVRITQPSPQSSPMTRFLTLNVTGKIGNGGVE